MTEAEARAYLSAHLPGLREPCQCKGAWSSDEAHWGEGLPTSCHGTGEVARDWHLEDLLAEMEAVDWTWVGGVTGSLPEREWGFAKDNRYTFASSPYIAAALALRAAEEKP